MRERYTLRWFSIILLLTATVPLAGSFQSQAQAAPSTEVTAFDLIIAMNTLRVSNGLPALVEDPIINAVSQSTANIMAANQMSWHIGDVSGRLAAAGYGGGATVWATENFAVGNLAIDQIMIIWSDASHMIPAVNPAYCNIGAGVAKAANGKFFYVLQAAYTSAKSCGEYRSPEDSPGEGEAPISQWIVPVKIATPDVDGKVYHVVEAGQSFWSIAIAYQITIRDLEIWNNLSRDSKLQIGQKLFIPGPDTEGYSTPTPVGMIHISTPDAEGKVLHEVQEYQTLTTIAKAYETSITRILNLNGIQADWPLQIGQKLVIDPGWITPSPTPRPLTPIEKLTPASDGNYYHIVKNNETLSWIAALYEISFIDLMAWNDLGESSVIRPEQRLLLHVTPPATATVTPGPPTSTLDPTSTPSSTVLPTSLPIETDSPPMAAESAFSINGTNIGIWVLAVGLVLAASLGIYHYLTKHVESDSEENSLS